MNCDKFERRIEAYQAGSVGDGLRKEMEGHLAACSACTRLVEAHGMVLESLGSTERLSAPSGLAEKILSAAAEENRRVGGRGYSRWILIRELAAAGATIVGLLAVAAWWFPREHLIFGGLSKRVSEGLAYAGEPVANIHGQLSRLDLTGQFGLILHTISGLLFQPIQIPNTPLTIPLYLPVLSIVAAVSLWSYLSSEKLSLSA
jgi:hypothetical protein